MSELSNKYALAALKNRRSEFAGEIVMLKRKLEWAVKRLEHVDESIRIFDPNVDPDALPVKRVRRRVYLFKQGELCRTVMDVLRIAEKPLGTAEIITGVMNKLGHGIDARAALTHRVRASLGYLEKQRGDVSKIGRARSARWKLT